MHKNEIEESFPGNYQIFEKNIIILPLIVTIIIHILLTYNEQISSIWQHVKLNAPLKVFRLNISYMCTCGLKDKIKPFLISYSLL